MRINKIIDEIKITLDAEDLGRAFYNLILYGFRGLKLIDFSTATGENNTFQVATELTYKNGNDEFRPDITVLINGLPLSFIEVKKPNNKDGIQAEYNRINVRFRNRKFKKFVNIIQFMVFSNNNQYDDNEIIPFEGAFYATSSYNKLFFNHFREEEESIFSSINPIDNQKEIDILRDTNHISIKYLPEYLTNLIEKSSTNKILTSLYSKDRIMFILKYAIAYVERVNDQGIINIEKHIMRYPQLFATKAIQSRLDCGMKNGVIWHTQGSGKTALVFFNIRSLTDYYQRKGIIAKFYFIVDRLDLLTQAADEFRARGLFVEEINSREDFIINIRSNNTTNNTGRNLITIVNIQKFSEESIVTLADYNVDVQRIYFLDEAHRSYKPTGSFLANLLGSDNDAVIIALTGTPLIIPGKKTEDIFGQYIHKYYYNQIGRAHV